jgi:hypothetical protein
MAPKTVMIPAPRPMVLPLKKTEYKAKNAHKGKTLIKGKDQKTHNLHIEIAI